MSDEIKPPPADSSLVTHMAMAPGNRVTVEGQPITMGESVRTPSGFPWWDVYAASLGTVQDRIACIWRHEWQVTHDGSPVVG